MDINMGEAIVTLKKGEGRTIKAGGMWIFDNEIASIAGSFENGDISITEGSHTMWVPSIGDCLADDWEVVE